MKDEDIERIKETIVDWKYMKELPESIRGFRLRYLRTRNEDVYNLYTYINEPLHRSATVYYHAETREYKVRFQIGSFEFCDEEFISSSLEEFEQLLQEHFEELLQQLTEFQPGQMDAMLKATHVLEWDYSSMLPDTLNGFELFIRPSQPFRITNGSYVIFDYEHFATRSNFAVYYNIYRDEFFGDLRVDGVPDVNYEFDSHTLEELQEKLSVHLVPRLQAILEAAKRSTDP